jgi:hypothetical protein
VAVSGSYFMDPDACGDATCCFNDAVSSGSDATTEMCSQALDPLFFGQIGCGMGDANSALQDAVGNCLTGVMNVCSGTSDSIQAAADSYVQTDGTIAGIFNNLCNGGSSLGSGALVSANSIADAPESADLGSGILANLSGAGSMNYGALINANAVAAASSDTAALNSGILVSPGGSADAAGVGLFTPGAWNLGTAADDQISVPPVGIGVLADPGGAGSAGSAAASAPFQSDPGFGITNPNDPTWGEGGVTVGGECYDGPGGGIYINNDGDQASVTIKVGGGLGCIASYGTLAPGQAATQFSAGLYGTGAVVAGPVAGSASVQVQLIGPNSPNINFSPQAGPAFGDFSPGPNDSITYYPMNGNVTESPGVEAAGYAVGPGYAAGAGVYVTIPLGPSNGQPLLVNLSDGVGQLNTQAQDLIGQVCPAVATDPLTLAQSPPLQQACEQAIAPAADYVNGVAQGTQVVLLGADQISQGASNLVAAGTPLLAQGIQQATPLAQQAVGFAGGAEQGAIGVAGGSAQATVGIAGAVDQGAIGLAGGIAQGGVGLAGGIAQGGVGLAGGAAQGAVGLAGGAAQGAVGLAGGAAGQDTQWLQDQVGQSTQAAQSAVGQATQWTQNELGQATQAAQSAVGQATQWTQNELGQATQAAQSAVGQATQWTQNELEGASQSVQSFGNGVATLLKWL